MPTASQIATDSWVRLGSDPGPMTLQATSTDVLFAFAAAPPNTGVGMKLRPHHPFAYTGSQNVYIKLRDEIGLGGVSPGGAVVYDV